MFASTDSYDIDSKETTPTVADALRAAAALGLDRLDAQLLLLQALGREDAGRAWVLAHDRDIVAAPDWTRFLAACERRATGEPLAYLVGRKEFFGLDLRVDARVLVPRPDTETLVSWALDALDALGAPAERPAPAVLDLGTGSGAIALAIQHARPDARVDAVDASADALAVAQANAARLGLAVRCFGGDWLDAPGLRPRYDLIASNPPYIRADDPHLAALAHEPLSALAAGPDGLADLRAIVRQAPARLAPGGWLLLEHGYDQAAAVRALLAGAGFCAIGSRRDLAGIERCSGGRMPGA
jgi:release factor glutamine methyltransferase